jgi:CheY-like chemotaxis protein
VADRYRAATVADRRPLVLVVEDDSEIRQALVEACELAGFEPVSAADGHEALTWLRTASTLPSVVLLDLVMPVLDGWQFLALRTPALRAVPVVVLSGRHDPLLPEGVAVLTKPVSLGELFDALRPYWKG